MLSLDLLQGMQASCLEWWFYSQKLLAFYYHTNSFPTSKSWVLDDKNAPGVQMRTLLQLQTILSDVITFLLSSLYDFTHIVADSYGVTK